MWRCYKQSALIHQPFMVEVAAFLGHPDVCQEQRLFGDVAVLSHMEFYSMSTPLSTRKPSAGTPSQSAGFILYPASKETVLLH